MDVSVSLVEPPLEVKEVVSRLPSAPKNLGSEPICELWTRAFLRAGYNAQSAAGLLGITPSQFSKDFSRNWPEQAAMLKRLDRVPLDVKQEFFALGAADCGLQVGIDWEDRNILLRFAQLLKSVEAK